MWYEQTDTEQTDTEQTDTKQPDTKQLDTKQPETKQPDTKQPETKTTREEAGPEYQTRLMMLCKRGKIKEAYGMLKSADKKGAVLTQSTYDQLIRALLAEGSMEEAMTVRDIAVTKVPDFKLSDIASSMLIITLSKRGQTEDALENLKSMLSADRVPSQLAFTRLTQALGNRGDVAGIQVVESLVKDLGTSLNLSSMIFVNNMALAHIKNGDLDSAVEVMEATVMNPDRKTPGMAYVFRKVLEENNDKALDKLSAMAERLANHFASYRLASDLFVVLLDMDKVEDAKFMLARLNGLAEQREVLLSYVAQKAQSPGQVGKIKTLANLIPDFIEKELLCTYLMKCHSMDKDLSSAKALYEEMQKEGRDVDKLSLKRLAVLYRNAGEIAPFPEPPESFKFYADDLKKRAEAQKATEE